MSRAKILRAVRQQSDRALSTGDVAGQPDLSLLSYLLKTAKPRAMGINYRGIRFPVRHSLWARVVCCPTTGVPLVGVIDV